MASWMIHLRVADRLLDRLDDLSPQAFIMDNIAPDSGVPNKDWSVFTPATSVSHFKDTTLQTGKKISIPRFVEKHFTPAMRQRYGIRENSFFLGYLVHLLTDILWADRIFTPTTRKFASEFAADKTAFISRVKGDWYDLDYLYLHRHPDFRAFRIYQNSEGFVNTFMDIFSPDALDNRRAYITAFYLQPRDDLDHPYRYLTEQEAGEFVDTCIREILEILDADYSIQSHSLL